MELLGAGAGAAALNAYGYNRDAWMTDVQLDQIRNHQKQQILLSQASMFRDDVRETVKSSVSKQNSYVIVLSLVLNVMENVFICSALPPETPDFLRIAFLACAGSSVVYLMLAVGFTIWANHLAVTCQKDMLMNLVRLPIADVSMELRLRSGDETVEAFEEQSVSKVLRVPFVGALRSRTSSSSPSRGGSRRSRSEPPMQRTAHAPAVTAIELKKAHRNVYMQGLERRMAEWHMLGKYTIIFGYLGLSMLLHGLSYFSVAKIFVKGVSRKWSFWIVQFLITSLVCTMTFLFGGYIKADACLRVLGAILELGGQASMFVAVRVTDEVSRLWSASACFIFHLLLNLLILHDHASSSTREQQLRNGKRPALPSDDLAPLLTSSTDSTPAGVSSGEEDVHSRNQRRRRVAAVGSIGVALAWALSAGWSVARTVKVISTNSTGTGAPTHAPTPTPQLGVYYKRRLAETDGAGASAALSESILRVRRELVRAKLQRRELEQRVAHLEEAVLGDGDKGGEAMLADTIDALVRRIDAAGASEEALR
uniref:Uncharacterized protein n=1 Tax=Alexandrium monilatum TaxID=311494 RepID=A0A7S4QQ68_9DINO